MRITENIRLSYALDAQAKSSERVADLTKIASSGMKVCSPSDDPTAYAAIVNWDARAATLSSRSTVATRAAGDLDLAESALASAGDILTRAKEIALEGADGTSDATARANLATERASLRTQLVGLANTRGASGDLFAGTKSDTQPFDMAGAFYGDDNVRSLQVADGVTAVSNASGAKAFTAAGGRDVFGDLQSLVTALQHNDVSGIQNSLSQLDDGQRQLVVARTDAGLAAERFHSAADVTDTAITAVRTARASEAEADAPKAYSDLEAAKASYERGIAVTREILSLTGLEQP